MSKTKNIPEAFCPLPWMHLATHPNGRASLCCRVNYAADEGFAESKEKTKINLNDSDIVHVMNSDSYKKARLEMLDGRWPRACLGCQESEANGLSSKRLFDSARFDFDVEAAKKITLSDGSLSETRLDFIELRLGNKCNLKCRTCNPHSSISWNADYQKLESQLDFVQKYSAIDVEWCESDRFWIELEKNLGQNPKFYINGGEPNLIEAHWKFLQKLVDTNKSKEIELIYNSNMTTLPDHAIATWKKFKHVLIGASIDAIGERNHYIRFPANWKKIEDNVRTLKSAGIDVMVTLTISAMNFYYIDEIMQWAMFHGLYVDFNFVYDPIFLSPQALPKEIRQEIFANFKTPFLDHQKQQLKVAANADDSPELWMKFASYTQALDQIRKQNFKNIFPELHRTLIEHKYEIG